MCLALLGTMQIWGWKGMLPQWCGIDGVCFTRSLAHAPEVPETLIWIEKQEELYHFFSFSDLCLHEQLKSVTFSDI